MRARLDYLLILVGLSGCAATERVVLLPDDITSKVGKINVVGRDGAAVLLDSAYGEVRAGHGRMQSGVVDPEALQRQFGKELAGLPPRPKSFQLYFLSGSDQLTPESRDLFASILDEVTRRPAPEVVVIGHTDRVGSLEYNDKLSLVRAKVVRDQLVAFGIDATHIFAAGRGEREPLVATDDEVPEPKNRRVEIEVR